MNILQRSLLLGIEIKKSKLAKNLIKSKSIAKDSINDLSWELFSKAAKKEYAYNKFPVGLEIIKLNKDHKSDYVRESVNNILQSKEILMFSDQIYKFRAKLNELLYSISQPYLLEESILFENQDIEREYRNFYADFIRLEIVQRLLSYKVYKNFDNSIKKIEILNKNMNNYHFWNSEVINEINSICINHEEKEILSVSNMMTSIMTLIEQVIYETHFDMITFLDVEDLQKYNKYKSNVDGIMEFELEMNVCANDGWIMVLNNKGHREVLLMTNKSVKFGQESGQNTTIKGVVYPSDDKNFIQNYINQI